MYKSPSQENSLGPSPMHITAFPPDNSGSSSHTKFIGIVNHKGLVLESHTCTYEEDVRGKCLWEFPSFNNSSLFEYQILQAIHSAFEGRTVHFSRTFDTERILFTFTPIQDAAKETFAAVAEITEYADEEINYSRVNQHDLLYTDPLTNLPNRLYFTTYLEKFMEQRIDNAPFLLMLVDLDRFNVINSGLGHQVGDGLLKEVARRLQSVMQGGDMLSRIDGDEFALILANPEKGKSIREYIEEVQACLKENFHIGSHTLHVTCTIGASIFPQHGADPLQITQNADIAMQQARKAGHNRYRIFSNDMHKYSLVFLTLENEMRQALERREFVMYFQPQYDFKEKRIICAEALIRWQHPIQGLMLPASFLPIAQESDMGLELERWAIEESARIQLEWKKQGINIPIAVNVSPTFFEDKSFIPIVEQIAKEGADMEIEITENTIMKNTKRTEAVIAKIKQLHIPLCLDDFGTGYSSLSCLQAFPLDKIKLDRTFMTLLYKEPSANLILRSIIELANALNLEMVAEGVERFDQVRFLNQTKCQVIQGFLISKAIPASEFVEFLGGEYVL